MSRPQQASPPADDTPWTRLHAAAVELDKVPETAHSPRQWFETAVKQAEAARAAERRNSKSGQYVAYTKLAVAYQKCKTHPRFKETKTADPAWGRRVSEFMPTWQTALAKAKALKGELKTSTPEEGHSRRGSVNTAARQTSPAVEQDYGGSIADRMKALSGHGMNVGSSSKRISRDMGPRPMGQPATHAASSHDASSSAAAARPDVHEQPLPAVSNPPSRRQSVQQPPPMTHPSPGRHSQALSASPSTSTPGPASTSAAGSRAPSPATQNGQAVVAATTGSSAGDGHPRSTSPKKAPLPLPPALQPQASQPARKASHPLPNPPSQTEPTAPPSRPPVTVPSASTAAATSPAKSPSDINHFEKAFPSLDELGKQFDDDGFALPALPQPNGKRAPLPEPPKQTPAASPVQSKPRHALPEIPKYDPDAEATEDATEFLLFPSLPSVPTDLPSAQKKPPLPPPPARPDESLTKAPSPPSPDFKQDPNRPASTLGFSEQTKGFPVSPPQPAARDLNDSVSSLHDLAPPPPTNDPKRSAASPHGRSGSPQVDESPRAQTKVLAAPPASIDPNIEMPSIKPRPEFPYTNSIAPEVLRSYLFNHAVDVLLLDVRPEEEFRLGYVGQDYYARGCRVNIVWLDPETVVMRPDVTSSAKLEDALSVSTDAQRRAFENRNKYDLVVVYDGKSTTWPPKGSHSPLTKVYELIHENEFSKALPRFPALLVGGYEGWLKFQHARGQMHAEEQRQQALRRSTARANGTPLAPKQSYPVDAKRTNREKPVYQASPYNKGITENFNHGPQSMTGNMHSYSASYGRSETYQPYQASSPSPRPMPRTSHASSNSISSYTTAAPYSSAPIAPPPRASAHASPMARRQSSGTFDGPGYSPYSPSSRPAIDYPQAHALVQVPQPPPAAAAHSLERQDVRVPRTVSSRNVNMEQLVSSSSSGVRYWRNTKLGITGLKNLGNTCYMNSTIQCLSATLPFARFFLDGGYKRDLNEANPLGTHGELARAFAKLLGALWEENYTVLSPITFRKSIIAFKRDFAGTDQHDSQEFLSFVLDGLHEDLNRVKVKPKAIEMTPEREAALESLPPQIASDKEWQIYKMRNDSLIVDLFQGQYMSRMECLTCHKTSTVYDSFQWLTLDLPASKSKVVLPELFDRWVQPEVLDGDEKWYCPRCQTRRRATKTLTLVRLPPVLLIQLKRFIPDSTGRFWNKSETPVIFPLGGLDLTRYVPARQATGAEDLDDPRTQIGPFKYDLYGVSNHMGTLSSGHYTAYVRSSDQWIYCEDSKTQPAREADVVSRPAYILFYKRIPA